MRNRIELNLDLDDTELNQEQTIRMQEGIMRMVELWQEYSKRYENKFSQVDNETLFNFGYFLIDKTGL